MAPSTLGTFLLSFTFGHVRQLETAPADPPCDCRHRGHGQSSSPQHSTRSAYSVPLRREQRPRGPARRTTPASADNPNPSRAQLQRATKLHHRPPGTLVAPPNPTRTTATSPEDPDGGSRLSLADVTQALRIRNVANRSGFSAPTLRYYEEIGLIPPPVRTSAGYACNDDSTLDRLSFIGRAKQLGCSLGVGTALGAASFGAGAIIVGGLLTAFVVRRRRRRLISAPCALPEPVAVAAPTPGSHR